MEYMQVEDSGESQSGKLTCLERTRRGFENVRNSRRLILVIVFIALFLDNMLLTIVVPIIPNVLWKMKHNDFNYTANCIEQIKNDTIAATFQHLFDDFAERFDGEYFHGRVPILNADKFYTEHIQKILLNQSEISDCFRRAESWRHKEMGEINIHVGLMFASKSVMQLIVNPFVGPLTNRIGYSIPMFSGFVVMFVSTIIFAFGESYPVLFVARAIQGIGSACSSVSGLGMLATEYPDDKERGEAMSLALGGLALGILAGPTFGGVMYQFVSKEAAFLVLAGLAVLDGALQLLVLKPGVRKEAEEGASLLKLLRDPYILLAAGSITFGNMGIAVLEPTLPIWMKETMHAHRWEQGVTFLPSSISYLLGTNLFGFIAFRIGRWLSAGLGMVLMGTSMIFIPFTKSLVHLIATNCGFGFAVGMIDSSMIPIMGHLVDLRHVSVYGSVYAIADIAFCLGFAIGPALSGSIVKLIGFRWTMWSIAIVSFCYAPLHYFLRDPPARTEEASLLSDDQKQIKYLTNDTTEGNATDQTETAAAVAMGTQEKTSLDSATESVQQH